MEPTSSKTDTRQFSSEVKVEERLTPTDPIDTLHCSLEPKRFPLQNVVAHFGKNSIHFI